MKKQVASAAQRVVLTEVLRRLGRGPRPGRS